MNFYSFAVIVIKGFIRLFNGKPHVTGLENLPKDNTSVILAATHRSLLDPFYIADILYPHPVAFMAKDTLFKYPILKKLLPAAYVFPVNREKPGTSSIKHSVSILKENQTHLGIFPSGSRYSTELKSGTAFIQKLSQSSIIPIVIQPPRTFWQFIFRKKAKIAFGTPIHFDEHLTYNKSTLQAIDSQLSEQFLKLDEQLTPGYLYIPKKKKT